MSEQTDETVDHAIDVVARAIAAEVSASWEDYPEIGEHDWDRVLTRISGLLGTGPSADAFHEAYNILAERAGGES